MNSLLGSEHFVKSSEQVVHVRVRCFVTEANAERTTYGVGVKRLMYASRTMETGPCFHAKSRVKYGGKIVNIPARQFQTYDG